MTHTNIPVGTEVGCWPAPTMRWHCVATCVYICLCLQELPPVYTPQRDELQRELWFVHVIADNGNTIFFDIIRQAKRVV
jgi:hypothetical protein